MIINDLTATVMVRIRGIIPTTALFQMSELL